ncbi:MAG: sigma-70 family RNA polymerase sigma factor [Enterococcus sp.]
MNEKPNNSWRDDEVFQQVFNDFLGTIFHIRGKYYLRDYEEDDWLQEARLVLYKSLEMFDASKGASLKTFFRVNFENKIISLVRYQSAQKRQAQNESLSLNSLINEDADYLELLPSQSSDVLEQLILEEALICQKLKFSSLELKVINGYFERLSFGEMADKYQLSEATVRSAYDRVRRKFSNYEKN